MVTTKEMNNPQKIKIKKNIDPVVNLYESTKNLDGRRDRVRLKITEDMERIKQQTVQD